MPVFGQLNASLTVNVLQQKFAALFTALEELEHAYQWQAQYSPTDLSAAPLNWPAQDADAIATALSDAHELYMTANGAAGFPTVPMPHSFLASLRHVTGPR